MELYVIYLLLLLKDFAVGENAASAIRDQKFRDPGVLINKLMPQKMYIVPNVVPKVKPVAPKVKVNPLQVNMKPTNKLNCDPKVTVPVVNQQKNTAPNVIEDKPIIAINPNQEPLQELKKTDLVQNDNKIENSKDSIQQDSEPKEPQFFEEVDDVTIMDTKETALNKPSEDKKQQDKTKKQDTNTDPNPSKITKKNPKYNQEKTITGNSSRTIPIVNEIAAKSTPVIENKIMDNTDNKTQIEMNIDYKQKSGRRANNPDMLKAVSGAIGNDAKYTIPITIYNFDDITDNYSKSRDYEYKGYPIGTDYSTYQQTNNVVIKNQDVEELCESTQDDTNPYEQTEYYNYEPYGPDYYQNNFPKYQNFPSYPKDRIWRNWKTTEIFISKYQPGFRNKYEINGFNTPITNGDMKYDAYNNMNPYQCYVYPMYKYM